MFNLRHASARNVIERIFGVLKRRFRILLIAPEYNLDIQAQIPTALCAIHNFIRQHEPEELPAIVDNLPESDYLDHTHDLSAVELIEEDSQSQPSIRRDQIAQAMWEDYQHVLLERAEEDMDIDSNESADDVF